ncbi:MAG: hypothetical protein WC156_08235 [Pedobacter sp.]
MARHMRLPRRLIASVLGLLFLAIIFSPLANLGLHSAIIAHATNGECSGDCDICGCSPERRATHTCCCWLKKLKNHPDHKEKIAGCCLKNKKAQTSILSGACPCGSGKQLALWGKEELQVLPYHFNGGIALLRKGTFSHQLPDRLVSRSVRPPVPPPELSTRS